MEGTPADQHSPSQRGSPESGIGDPRLDLINYVNGRPLYLGRNGRPITLRQWAEQFADIDARTLARDNVNGTRIITCWLGLDAAMIGPPQIYGTALMHGQGTLNEYLSTTEEMAMIMHALVLAKERGDTIPANHSYRDCTPTGNDEFEVSSATAYAWSKLNDHERLLFHLFTCEGNAGDECLALIDRFRELQAHYEGW